MTLTAESLVNESLELVSPPTTYSLLHDIMSDPNSSADDISDVINTDPALAARLLKVVNSSFYGFPSQINTISRAITIIGTSELTHLVLATSVMSSFKGIDAGLIKLDEFWRHSLACAMMSKLLARQCKQRAAERFFIAGLLQNIGSLVIYQSLPELAQQAISSANNGDEILFQAEKRLIGFDHTEVGQALIQEWRLPNSLGEVVRYHHSPSQATQFSIEVAIVHIADIMVSSAQLGHSGTHHVAPLDPAAWDMLGLDENDLPDLLQQVTEQLDDLTAIMTSS